MEYKSAENSEAPVALWRLALRYLLPVTARGPLRLDPWPIVFGYKRYLLRCGVMVMVLYALGHLFEARGHELLHGLTMVAIFPFGTVAVSCAVVWWELRGEDIDP